MKLSPQQRAAVDENDRHVLVIACPGSGKTRTIVARLIRSIERVRNTPRRVACITYTNAAANEIERRVRHLVSGIDAEYCDIGTIHSFCLRSVIRPFHGRLEGYSAGVSVVPADSDAFVEVGREALHQAGLGITVRPIEFGSVRRGTAGEPLIPRDVGLTEESVRVFWRLLRDRSLMDFPSISYYAFWLLDQYPHIARTVSSRYREILIDEMQDTGALQVQLLQRIADAHRSRFVLVGDPEQSIYGFAGAEPERMFELAHHIDARDDFALRNNWRSSRAIVDLADALRPRDEPMIPTGPDRDYPVVPELVVSESAVTAVLDRFLPLLANEGVDVGKAAVLAPAWFLLIPIARELRRRGIPVSGPGSRPYNRRGRLLTGLLEHVCACVTKTRPHILPRIQYEMFDAIQNIEGSSRFEVWNRPGRVAAMEMVFRARELRQDYPTAIPWIEQAAITFARIMVDHGLMRATSVPVLEEAAQSIVGDIRSNRDIEPAELTVDDLGTFANPDGSLRLLTLHAAKGREFDAVCVVEVQEGRIPHPRGNVAESLRVLYVAVTRPRKLLMLAQRVGTTPSPFLLEPAVQACMGIGA